MDIKYEIETVFKIEFFKIKCIDFKKKKDIQKILKKYPEVSQSNFSSNRNKADIAHDFSNIFKHEFLLVSTKYNSETTSNNLRALYC